MPGGGVAITLVREPSVQQAGVVTVSVPKEMATSGAGFSFPLPARVIETAPASSAISVTMLDGGALPAWLGFNPETRVFTASAVPDGAFPLQVVVTVGGNRSIVVISERSE